MIKKRKVQLDYITFLLAFYVFIFQDLLDQILPVFGYADEVLAALAVPISLIELSRNGWRIKKKKSGYRKISFCVLVFIVIGLCGNIIYKYQPFISAVLPDLIINLKFWLAIYVSMRLFKRVDIDTYARRIIKHVKFSIFLLFALTVLDYVFNLYPTTIRYGFRAIQLFYGVPTSYAASCAFLLSMIVVTKGNNKHYKAYIALLFVMMASTLRVKAFGSILLFVIIYYLVYIFKSKIKARHVVLLGAAGLAIGWSQIQYYFFSSISDTAARSMLLRKCFEVAKDHFPLGAGLATYASYYSGLVYSPLYLKYGLSGIYGLTANHPVYVSDSFWPMIIGQNGYIGLVFFVLAICYLFKEIQKVSNINKDYYMAAVFSLAYVCVASMAESAFVAPITMPMAIVIGLVFNNKDKKIALQNTKKIINGGKDD